MEGREREGEAYNVPSVGRTTSWNVFPARNLLNISSACSGRSMGRRCPVTRRDQDESEDRMRIRFDK